MISLCQQVAIFLVSGACLAKDFGGFVRGFKVEQKGYTNESGRRFGYLLVVPTVSLFILKRHFAG